MKYSTYYVTEKIKIFIRSIEVCSDHQRLQWDRYQRKGKLPERKKRDTKSKGYKIDKEKQGMKSVNEYTGLTPRPTKKNSPRHARRFTCFVERVPNRQTGNQDNALIVKRYPPLSFFILSSADRCKRMQLTLAVVACMLCVACGAKNTNEDAYIDGDFQIQFDRSQDCQLEGHRGNKFQFRRRFSTCDPKDFAFETGTTQFIVAGGYEFTRDFSSDTVMKMNAFVKSGNENVVHHME
ncbi:hypothetical protein TELCIR_13399, partial [Teladorsagia circumcincta]